MRMTLDYDSDRLPRVVMTMEMADFTFVGRGDNAREAAQKLADTAGGHMTLEDLMKLGEGPLGG